MQPKTMMVVTHAGGSPKHGPNTRWYYLARALKPLGIRVEIVSSSFFHKYVTPPSVERLHTTEEIDGVIYHWIRTRPYRRRGVRQIANQLEFVAGCRLSMPMLLQRKPDVVVASSPHPMVVWPALWLSRKTGARLVYEGRDLWPKILVDLGAMSYRHPYAQLLSYAEKTGVLKADRVFSVKPGDIEYYAERYGIDRARFRYFPNGFLPMPSDGEAPDSLISIRERYTHLVGYVGALSAYYGLQDLIELAECYRLRSDVGFVIIGDGDQRENLTQNAADLGLNNLHFLGPVPKKTVLPSLKLFDVCYLGLKDVDSNRFGISCNKLFEYMYAEKPILGSYKTEYDPVLDAACGKVVQPGDSAALSAALASMLTSAAEQQQMGANGRRYFDANHDFRQIAAQMAVDLFGKPTEESIHAPL